MDKEQHERLRKRFNPEGSDLRRLQLRQVEMLKYIDDVCRRNDIKYWLAAGNLLGYVRHFGEFIPWDDDVDIELETSEYKRLIAALKAESHPDFEVQDGYNDRYFDVHFAKLRDKHSIVSEAETDLYRFRGCYLDIFPLRRALPPVIVFTTELRKRYFGYVARNIKNTYLRKALTLAGKYAFLRCLFPALSFITRPFTKKDIIYHSPSSVAVDFAPRRLENIYPLQRVVFEGVEVYAPGNTDGFLRDMYGDYMTVPDTDKIHFHFDRDKIVWKD